MKLIKPQRVDATTGNLLHSIIIYTIPLILGTLTQTCFNAIDLAVLGNMADSNAVASVGATSMIISLLVNSFIGIAGGAKIILAHYFGAKNAEKLQKTASTSLIISIMLGVLIAILGILLAPFFLNLTNCPSECYNGALVYIRIYVAAAPAILIYNFGAAIITASGDSQRPLYYIILSGLVNIVFNILFCLTFSHKVAAVATATLISQIVGAFLVLNRLVKMDGACRISLKKLDFDKKTFGKIMLQGLPLALNNALYPFANLQIQSAINTFGVSAISGNSTCMTVEGIPGSVSGSFGSTATVFIGQNLGADEKKRADRSFWYCILTSCLIGFFLGTGIYLTGRFWLSLFLPNDQLAIDYGMIRMFYIVLFYPIACANSVLGAAIQAHGHAPYTAFSSILCVCVFRLIWMWFIYPHFQVFDMLMACFLVSWLLCLLFNIFGYLLYCKKLFKLPRFKRRRK